MDLEDRIQKNSSYIWIEQKYVEKKIIVKKNLKNFLKKFQKKLFFKIIIRFLCKIVF